MTIRRSPRNATSSHHRARSRARWLLAAATLATGAAMSAAADAAAPAAFAAQAELAPGSYYIGDWPVGSVYTFAVKNTGTSTSIGAVDIVRPVRGFLVASCPAAPAGWTATASATRCSFRSAASKSDDIKPGATKTFGVRARTYRGTSDRSGTWRVVVSSNNRLSDTKLLKTATPTGRGLTVRLRTFEVTTAVVRATTPTLGAACPPARKTALAGIQRTIVVCGRNHAMIALKPVATYSLLGGTMIGTKGTFAATTIPASSKNVVLANWTGTTITGVPGADKTIVAKIGAASSRLSHLTRLAGYTALSNPPVAGADAYATPEDTVLTVPAPGVLGNDSDPDGTAMTAVDASDPAHGSVTLDADGGFVYTPDANYHGPDSFTYVASDGLAVSPPVTVAITVGSIADAPVAVDDTASTGENAATAIPVLGNDSDADGDTLTLSSTDGTGLTGQISANGGVVTYDPNGQFESLAAGQSDTETFGYVVSDGALTDTGSVTVTVTGVNDAPVAVNDGVYQTLSDTALPVAAPGLLANDTDVDDGATLSVTGVGSASNGTVTFDSDGAFEYTPAPGFSGSDSFTYTVSDGTATDTGLVQITVVPPNAVPTANPASGNGLEDGSALTIQLAGADGDGDALTFDVGTASNGLVTVPGSVTCDSNTPSSCTASVTYTPNANFNGTDSFTYTVSDGTAVSAPATVTVTIAAVNDPPSFTKGADQTVTEDAAAQSVSNWATAISKGPANESGQTLSFTTSNDNNALFSVQPGVTPTGTLVYTPAPNQFGSATVTITLGDDGGTANGGVDTSPSQVFTITVGSIADAPVAVDDTASTGEDAATAIPVLGNDSDGDGDTLTLSSTDGTGLTGQISSSGGVVTYDPNGQFESLAAGQSDTETFGYVVSDGALTDTGSVTVTVTGVNDAPVAVDDGVYQTPTDTALPVAAPGLLANDTDVDDGATLAVTGVGAPSNGTVTFESDGAFEYTPAPNFGGSDSFTYTVSDGTATDTGLVQITVVRPNADPTAYPASANGLEDGSGLTIQLVGADDDGDALTFEAGTASNGLVTVPGSVTCDGNTPSSCTASVTYTPNPNFNGTDSFTYTVSDGTAVSAPATVTVTIGAVNDSPSFTKGADQTVLEDAGAQSVSNWASAMSKGPGDESAQSLSFTTSNDNNALFSVQPGVTPTGTLAYTPAPNQFGSATVTISLADDGGTANGGVDTSPSQVFTITVTPVNDVPVADDDTHNPHEDQLANINVLDGDIDADPADTLTVSGLTNTDADGNDGVLTVNSDHTVSYDPRGEFDHLQVGGSEVDTFTYTVSDGNGGTDTATVTVTVTGVNDNPTATPKSHTAIGNTLLVVNEPAPAGAPHTSTTANHLLVGVTDPDDTVFTASAPATTAAGANITHDATDGSFSFLPAQGVGGAQAFTFTVNDAHGGSDTDTVAVTVSDMVWYMNSAGAAGGTGRSTQPFTTLAPISTGGTADAKDGAGDHVFVYSGSYAGGLVLESSQKLWGQPQGLTVASTPLVAAGGTNPVVSNAAGDAITLASGADVQRVDAGASSGFGIKGVSVTTATVGPNTTVSDGVSLTGAATGTISVGSTISNTSGRAVDVANRSGGAVTFTGPVTDTGAGVVLASNTGATVSLTGQLTLSTTTNDAFTATGGGTVVAPHTSNAITTTGGRGVNVANTTIGATNLVFRSVNVNAAGSASPANGIVLNNTGATGNLTVLGTGANGSGGTIRGTTGPAVSLTTTRDVALAHVTLQDSQSDGVTGSGVTNLTLTNVRVLGAGDADEERAVDLVNTGGVLTITGGLYDDAADDLVKVHNTSTNATVNVTGNATFSNQTQTLAGNAFDFVPNGTSAITAAITGNTFTNLKNTSVNWGAGALGSSGASALTFTSNSVNGGAQGGAGVVVSGQEGTTTTTTISNNTFTGAGGNGVVNHDVNDTSVVLATVQGNTFSSPKGHGIVAAVDEDGDIRLRVDGNTISNAGGDGIELTNFGDDSVAAMTSTAHFIVTNNTINTHSLNPATQFVGAIGLFHFENDADTTCARVTGNTVTGTPVGFYDIFLQDSSNLGKFRFEEVPDTAATGAVSAAYIQSKNPGTAASKIENISAVYSNGVSCTNP